MEQMYSLKSVAKLLDVSVKTVRRLIHRNNIITYTVSSRMRMKESDLIQLITIEKPMDDYRLSI